MAVKEELADRLRRDLGYIGGRISDAYTGANRDPAYADAGEIDLRSFQGNTEAINGQILASLLASDEAEFVDIILQHAPELADFFTQDTSGRYLLELPGQPPQYINEPGMSGADIGGIVRDIITFLPAARVATIGRAALTRVAKGSLAGGATSVARDIGAEAAGSEQGINWTEAGIIGLAEGATMGAFPPVHRGRRAFHGTRGSPFNEFDPSRFGTVSDKGWMGEGAYLATHRPTAGSYARQGEGRGSTMEFDVTMNNPLNLSEATDQGATIWSQPAVVRQALGLEEGASASAVTRELQRRGHEGVVWKYGQGQIAPSADTNYMFGIGPNQYEFMVMDPSNLRRVRELDKLGRQIPAAGAAAAASE